MTHEPPILTRELRKSFDSQTRCYDSYAVVQHIAARKLAELMQGYSSELGGGPIVELGAGTGMVTEHLIRLFPSSDKVVTDLSPNMISYLTEKYSEQDHIHFDVHDANSIHPKMETARAIVCGFTLQWLTDPVNSVTKWVDALRGPSWVFLTWPGDESFPEWRNMSEKSGLAYTGNPLPGAEIVDQIIETSGTTLLYHAVEPTQLEYRSSLEFFRSIREIGAGQEQRRHEGRRNLLKLIRVWDKLSDSHITATYMVHTAVIFKP
jgi:malonyl-CoA O-methyltransferase